MKVVVLLLLTIAEVTVIGGTSADSIANDIGQALGDYLDGWYNIKWIESVFNRQKYKIMTGKDILRTLKLNISKQFNSSEDCLLKIRDSALNSYYNYEGDSPTDFDFLSRFSNKTHKNISLTYDRTANFKRPVSVSNSSLVLPTNIYFNWTEIRETILWTEKMDSTFKSNWSPVLDIVPCYPGSNYSCSIPHLTELENRTGSATMLQYIGTPLGVMRVYPSYYTAREGKWLFYDHRFRIWYAVGAMESNKIVFLMDKSGTLFGQPLRFMKDMAKALIRTMISDEDYISILTFNDEVKPLGCGKKLVRARGRITKILRLQIENIEAGGPGNITNAIKEGFEVFNTTDNKACHKTIVLFTDYSQIHITKTIEKYNIDNKVRVVIIQVGKDIMFATDLRKVAEYFGGFYSQIKEVEDINPTILELTSSYTAMVDQEDLEKARFLDTDSPYDSQESMSRRRKYVKSTPMYRDASTDEYITTLVLPVVTGKPANWTFKSTLDNKAGQFLGVAAVDIEAKSLGAYPLSHTRGCYAITTDVKGSILYHPSLYRAGFRGKIEIDQKLHLYSQLNEGDTMFMIEKILVFQNSTETQHLPYLQVSDESTSLKRRGFVKNYYFATLTAVQDKVTLLHVCYRESLAFTTGETVNSMLMSDVVRRLGHQVDNTRDTAYCSYKTISYKDYRDMETVGEYVIRKLQFPECHSAGTETLDDIRMASIFYEKLTQNINMSITAASGNRFQVYTRERYARLITLITNNRPFLSVTNVNRSVGVFELSQAIYHKDSDSYPLILTVALSKAQFDEIIRKPFMEKRVDMGGKRYLVDENGFVVASSDKASDGIIIAELFPKLMKVLLKEGIFGYYNHTECYFSCTNKFPFVDDLYTGTSNAGFRLYPYFSSLSSITSTFLYALFKLFLILIPPLPPIFGKDLMMEQSHVDLMLQVDSDLTCCHYHPFFSRNYSVNIPLGSNIPFTPSCLQHFRYSSVPQTNLLFVWAFCTGEHCLCEDKLTYNLDSKLAEPLNPCDENDDNYNPAHHCEGYRYLKKTNSSTALYQVSWVSLIPIILNFIEKWVHFLAR